jgi:hypothetical protein
MKHIQVLWGCLHISFHVTHTLYCAALPNEGAEDMWSTFTESRSDDKCIKYYYETCRNKSREDWWEMLKWIFKK